MISFIIIIAGSTSAFCIEFIPIIEKIDSSKILRSYDDFIVDCNHWLLDSLILNSVELKIIIIFI